MRNRVFLAAIILCALALPGCGRAPSGGSRPGDEAAKGMAGAAPLVAALVTPSFGWVLTPDEFLTTEDGGATLTKVDVPVPAGPARAAYFADAKAGVVAAAFGDSITVATTGDGGRTWHTASARDPAVSPAGYSSLALSFGDTKHGAIVARTATSQAFSLGTLFATVDGGATWVARPAPESGRVTVEPGGRIWLAGANLETSIDQGQTWTRAELRLAGAGAGAAVSPPVGDTLPVTVINDDRTEVQLLTTADGGRTWDQPKRLPVLGKVGPDVRVPVASTATGPVVFDTTSGHAYQATGVDLRASGLPDGVREVTFAKDGRTGWALAGYGRCGPASKRDCRYHHDLTMTTDGGTSWHPIATWTRPVG